LVVEWFEDFGILEMVQFLDFRERCPQVVYAFDQEVGHVTVILPFDVSEFFG
jgi:hypothetical protein